MTGFSVSAVESIVFFQQTIRFTYLVNVGHRFSSNKRTHRSLKTLILSKFCPQNYPPFLSF